MRPHQVFARMRPEEAEALFQTLHDELPGAYTQAVAAASAAFKARPQFLMKQPAGKRADMARRALSRVAADPLAEEILAAYFLELRRELLVEWLDGVGVEHEDGMLQDPPPAPEATRLRDAVATFMGADPSPDRALLLEAFAAQSAIEWPELEACLAERAAR
jgi:hypothetical protein